MTSLHRIPIALAAVLCIATTAHAQDADLARRLSGTWVLATSREQAVQTVDRAIDRTTAAIPIVGRALVGELRESNPTSSRIVLDVQPNQIHAHFDDADFRTAPGVSTRVRVPSGEMVDLVQLVRGDHLEEVFTSPRGRRWSTFTPSADGSTMTIATVVRSPLLPEDLRYELTYRRAQ